MTVLENLHHCKKPNEQPGSARVQFSTENDKDFLKLEDYFNQYIFYKLGDLNDQNSIETLIQQNLTSRENVESSNSQPKSLTGIM